MSFRRPFLWLALPLLAVSCASLRPQDASRKSSADTASDSSLTGLDSVAVGPNTASYPENIYFRRAFRDLQWADESGAAAWLDSASVALHAHVLSQGPEASAGSGPDLVRVLSGTRVVVELYHDLLPAASPISPESPFGRLIADLPVSVRQQLSTHPYYREVYLRHLAGLADVPVDLTPETRQSITFFTTSARKVFEQWLDRSGDYRELIEQELKQAGLPLDLIYLAMVESGFNPKAYSRAHAVGIWQFASHTGRLYGLRRNTWIDNRRDPVKSTQAAVRHLQHLYEMFPDWRLVVAAYNCGQGRLSRSIQRAGTNRFWELDSLPRETRKHVPRFMAAAVISKDPEWFGFEPPGKVLSFAYDEVTVHECVDLRVAAECAGTTYERMRMLNPELRRGYTPPVRGKTYALRVPPGTAARFQDRYARLPLDQRVRMVDYRVRSGDTVSQIARKMGVGSQVVMDANQIRNARRLRAGALLQIPLHPDLLARYTPQSLSTRQPDPFTHIRDTYRVRRGDSLWKIAKREGVTPEQIRSWNGLRASQYIYPGDRLVIWRPSSSSPRSTGGALALQGEYYTVRRGDTLWQIARTFRTSVSELKQWNGIRNASRIRANSKLRVKPPGPSVD